MGFLIWLAHDENSGMRQCFWSMIFKQASIAKSVRLQKKVVSRVDIDVKFRSFWIWDKTDSRKSIVNGNSRLDDVFVLYFQLNLAKLDQWKINLQLIKLFIAWR